MQTTSRTISLGELVAAAYDGALSLSADTVSASQVVALAVGKVLSVRENRDVARRLRYVAASLR